MRNSTVETRKGQGPIRTGAVVPFLILVALVWGYFHFFFDGHLRRGLEYAGTRAVGAEVDVAEVETSFWHASAVIRGIKVTDASRPERNLVEIGSVGLQALWDGLLRGKVVIEHANVLDVAVLTPRATPGRVLPPDPESEGVTDRLLGNVKRQFAGNILGDAAAMLDGADPMAQIGTLDDNLKSRARIAELQQQLPRKQKEWETRLAALPTPESVAKLQQRLSAVKLDRFKDVKEVRDSLAELDAIRAATNDQVKKVEGTSGAINADLTALHGAWGGIDDAVKADVSDLQARFRIPELDAATIGNVVFGPEVIGKVTGARRYMNQAREYLPPRRSAEAKAALRLQPPPRGKGRDYTFGRPRAYPAFWLKSATISSRSGKGPCAGDLSGTLTDVTTDPALVGRPLVLRLQGGFPGLSISDARLELVVDHTGAVPQEKLDLQVGRFPVAGRSLVSGDAVSLGFDKAGGSARLGAVLSGDAVDLRLNNEFNNIAWQVNAKSPAVRELVGAAVNGVSTVDVSARVSGSWSKLDWYLATNLGNALQQGLSRQLQAKVAQARARIQSMVNERIGAERAKLQAEMATVEGAARQRLEASRKELDKLRAQLDKARGQLDRQQKAQGDKLREGAGQLLKGTLGR